MITEHETLEFETHIWAVPTSDYARELDPTTPMFTYELYNHTQRCWTQGAVKVAPATVTATVPAGVNLVQAALDTLQEEIDDINKRAKEETLRVQHKMQELLLLAGPSTQENVISEQ